MWRSVAAFELRTQLRSPVFAIVWTLTALLVFGSVTTERIRIGPEAGGLRNGPETVLQVHGLWSLFFAFTAAAFAIEAALRDEATGFGPVLRATPLRARDWWWGRFTGAFSAVLAAFTAVPLGLLAGGVAPWVDPALLGPMRPDAYAVGLLAIGLPNLFLLTAVMFALAAAFRSAMAAYPGATGLLLLYGLGSEQVGAGVPSLLEPFGFAALRDGGLLANRLLWTAVGAAGLLAGAAAFRWTPRASAGKAEAVRADPPPAVAPLAAPRFGMATAWAQLAARTRWEVRSVVRSWPFAVAAGLSAANVGAALWGAAGAGADTPALIARTIESFRLVPLVVALFYAGELVWAERDARTHEIVGAAPAPDWTFLPPKLAALALVLLGLLAFTAGAGMTVDALRGAPGLDARAWLAWYVLPRAYDWLIFAALAVFLQTVSPSKLAGWGWITLYLISALTLESLGLNDGLYRYGGRLDGPLAELMARDAARGALLRLYWGAFAGLLVVLALALHGRGAEPRWRGRLSQAGRRLRGRLGAAAALAGAAFAASGAALAWL